MNSSMSAPMDSSMAAPMATTMTPPMNTTMEPNMNQSPIEIYNSLLASNKFVFLVFYRGHWCPFCMGYLKTLQTLLPSITAAGGHVQIVTAENSSFLAETRKRSGYQGGAMSDPKNELATYLRERGLIDVAISEKKGYENGMAQPAILVMDSKGEVFEKWAIVPSAMNIGGAKDRPELEQVWDNVKAKMEGRERVHGEYRKIGLLKTVWGMIFG